MILDAQKIAKKLTPGRWVTEDQYKNRWPVPAVHPKVPFATRREAPDRVRDDPTRDGQKQRYQESTNIWYPSSALSAVVRELCRFSVEEGRIGIVRGLWQWGEMEQPGSGITPIIASPYDARLFLRNGVDVSWHLRLSYGITTGELVQIASPNALPLGDGYRELPNWYDVRFPWGTNAPVFWTVPTNHTLRLFVKINFGVPQIESIGGRMWGYTQSINKYAQQNTRHGWEW